MMGDTMLFIAVALIVAGAAALLSGVMIFVIASRWAKERKELYWQLRARDRRIHLCDAVIAKQKSDIGFLREEIADRDARLRKGGSS